MRGDALEEHVYHHFQRLFGRKKSFRVHLKEDAWKNEVELSDLDEEFREEEIKRVVWKLGQDKAPGSDGFPLFFLKFFWEDVKGD